MHRCTNCNYYAASASDRDAVSTSDARLPTGCICTTCVGGWRWDLLPSDFLISRSEMERKIELFSRCSAGSSGSRSIAACTRCKLASSAARTFGDRKRIRLRIVIQQCRRALPQEQELTSMLSKKGTVPCTESVAQLQNPGRLCCGLDLGSVQVGMRRFGNGEQAGKRKRSRQRQIVSNEVDAIVLCQPGGNVRRQ